MQTLILSQSPQKIAVQFHNSSSSISEVHLFCNSPSLPIISANTCTTLIIANSGLTSFHETVPFTTSGQLLLSNISIRSLELSQSIVSTLCSGEPFADVLRSSQEPSIALHNSLFMNILVNNQEGSFISSKAVIYQEIRGCMFDNLTFCHAYGHIATSEECSLLDSTVCNGEEGIYGEILTGMTSQTLTRFVCANTTFKHCIRSAFLNEEASSISYSSQQVLDGSETNVFTNCVFDQCTSTESGGALTLSGDAEGDSALEVSGCVFTECGVTSDSGDVYYGGAVYCVCGSVEFRGQIADGSSGLVGSGGSERQINTNALLHGRW